MVYKSSIHQPASASVSSLNGLTGAVTLAAGTNVTITPAGNTLTIASSGGGSPFALDNNGTIYSSDTNHVADNGSFNFITGDFASNTGQIGSDNFIAGRYAGGTNSAGTASSNIFVGFTSGVNLTSGDYNTALGYRSANDLSSGNHNIFVGDYTGINVETSDNNINIGNGATVPDDGGGKMSIANLLYGTGLDGTGLLSTGNVGIGTATPSSKLDVVPNSLTVAVPLGASASLNAIGVAPGYPFGSGSIGYSIYAEISGYPLFSTAASASFSESPTDYDPINVGNATFNYGSSGYTADGNGISYQIWAIYNNSQQSLGSVSISTGTDANDGSSYAVTVPWNLPSAGAPQVGFLVSRYQTDTGSTDYQALSSSTAGFIDANSGWGGNPYPGYGTLQYNVLVNFSASAGADNYIVVDSSHGTYITGSGTSYVDDSTWTSGSPATTPTAIYSTGLTAEGPTQIATGGGAAIGFFGATPSTQLSGDIVDILQTYGLISSGDYNITGETPYSIFYADSGGTLATGYGLRTDGSRVVFGADSTLLPNVAVDCNWDMAIRHSNYSSTGVQSNVSTGDLSNLRFTGSSNVTFTGFADGFDGKLLFIENSTGNTVTLRNQATSSTGNQIVNPSGTDLVMPSGSAGLLIYDSSSGFWRTMATGKPDLTVLANTWLSKQTFFTSTASLASIFIPAGVTPTSPLNGDIWATTAHLFAHVAGATYQLDQPAVLSKVTNYNGIATAGNGLMAIVASGRSVAQSAAVSNVTSYSVPAADSSFHISANVLVTASTLHNFIVTCAYTDEGNTARTLTLSFSQLAGTFLTTIANAGGAVPYEGIPLRIRCKASTTITIATTGTFTTVTYNVEASIVQIA